MKKTVLLIIVLLTTQLLQAQWTQIGQDIDGIGENDWFGITINLSADGNIMAVGSPNHNSLTGQVRVYQNIANVWTQIGSDLNGIGAVSLFGLTVSLSADGSILAVGEGDSFSGHTAVYQYLAGDWVQIGDNITDGAGQEISLSADGSTLVVGSYMENGSTGVVRIFENQAGTWTQIGGNLLGEANEDHFGFYVSINADGSIIAASAYLNDNNGEDAGNVRVYENLSGTWTQVGNSLEGENAGDRFGCQINLNNDGSILAIGADSNDGNGTDAGHVRVFENLSGTWALIGDDLEGESAGCRFGTGVNLNSDGSVLVVGSGYDDDNLTETGYVQVFRNQSGSWVQIEENIYGEAAMDRFGSTVELSSDASILAVGAFRNNNSAENAGHVRVYSDGPLSVKNINFISSDIIYPNPAREQLTINISAFAGISSQTVEIYNMQGQLVKQSNASKDYFSSVRNDEIQIDISDLENGVYIVRVDKQTKKLIIE